MDAFRLELQTVSSYRPVNVHWWTWALPIKLLYGDSEDHRKTVMSTQVALPREVFTSLEFFFKPVINVNAVVHMGHTAIT